MKLIIAGYTQEANCEHCGRLLVHGVRLADGRVVGADCLNNKMTKAKTKSSGTKYRVGASYIIKAAKVVQFEQPTRWNVFGVNKQTIEFEAA